MAPEAMLQLGILILTLSTFFVMHNLRKQSSTHTSTTRPRYNNSNNRHHQSKNRHLAQSSRHLARARSTSQPHSTAHAKTALIEADQALSISPRDPSPHILRALALDLMGHRAAALRSLDAALSPPLAKSLSPAERADALVKRAELKVAVNRRRRVDSAVEDLTEAVSLSGGTDSVALCLLGKCYEWKGMMEKAKEAFHKAFDVEPDSVEARNGLERLGP